LQAPECRHGLLTSRAKPRFEPVLDHIAKNMGRRITLDELAEAVGMSRFAFSRAFRAETGLTPMKFVLLCRVECATRRIIETDAQLALIALECGFASQSHMTTAVKAVAGVTPGAYRATR
jgi:AraC family transcriptional regulator